MNKDFCNKCGECCRKIPVDFERGVIYRDGVQNLSQEFASFLQPISKTENITFCSCKFLKNKLCTNLNKPNECILYPSSPFAFLPDDCGYEGDIFFKREEIKQKVRKLKEEIIYYESLQSKDRGVEKVIERNKSFVQRYKIYGSDTW